MTRIGVLIRLFLEKTGAEGWGEQSGLLVSVPFQELKQTRSYRLCAAVLDYVGMQRSKMCGKKGVTTS
ncbi:MAG: hypothetical protein AB9861_20895 [Methanosarcina sp.]|jgi:hypothetical protein